MYNSCLIQLLFTKKNNFFTKFSSNFELSIKFTQIKKVRFIDVIIPLRSVSTNVSNCIVLNFMYTKFQVSSSKKWQSYWYSNMVHLLLITLYLQTVLLLCFGKIHLYTRCYCYLQNIILLQKSGIMTQVTCISLNFANYIISSQIIVSCFLIILWLIAAVLWLVT